MKNILNWFKREEPEYLVLSKCGILKSSSMASTLPNLSFHLCAWPASYFLNPLPIARYMYQWGFDGSARTVSLWNDAMPPTSPPSHTIHTAALSPSPTTEYGL